MKYQLSKIFLSFSTNCFFFLVSFRFLRPKWGVCDICIKRRCR